jgi:hypothetical protein
LTVLLTVFDSAEPLAACQVIVRTLSAPASLGLELVEL